jgi:hypothetical protein
MNLPRPRQQPVVADHVHLKDRDDRGIHQLLLTGIGLAADEAVLLGIEQDESDRPVGQRAARKRDEALGNRHHRRHAAGVVVDTGRRVTSGIVRGAGGRRGIKVSRYQNQFRRCAGELRFDVVQLPPGVRELVQPDRQFPLADSLKLFGNELRRGLVSGMENMPVRPGPAGPGRSLSRAPAIPAG